MWKEVKEADKNRTECFFLCQVKVIYHTYMYFVTDLNAEEVLNLNCALYSRTTHEESEFLYLTANLDKFSGIGNFRRTLVPSSLTLTRFLVLRFSIELVAG